MIPEYRHPSAGVVDTTLAQAVFDRLGDGEISDFDRQQILRLICHSIDVRRYPTVALADFIAAHLGDTPRLRQFLKNYLAMKSSLGDKLSQSARDYLKFREGDGVLVYGYSEPVLATLSALLGDQPPDWKGDITMFVPEASNRLHRGDAIRTVERLAELGLPVSIISDISIGHHLLWPKDARQPEGGRERDLKRPIPKINKVLLGCKSIILKGKEVKFNCMIGARMIAHFAKSNHAEVYVFGETYKIWDTAEDEGYLQEIRADEYREEDFGTLYDSPEYRMFKANGWPVQIENFVSDIVPALFINYLITEVGGFSTGSITRQDLIHACERTWPALWADGFWDLNTRLEGRVLIDRCKERSAASLDQSHAILSQLLTHEERDNVDYLDRYVRELLAEIGTKSSDSGRQELARLIVLATALQKRSREKADPTLHEIAENAWRGASLAFRDLRMSYIEAAHREERVLTDEDADVTGRYIFCERRVRDYETLEKLEHEADLSVQQLRRGWEDLAATLTGPHQAGPNVEDPSV
jgi:initiation factor 2B subunit 1/2 family protein